MTTKPTIFTYTAVLSSTGGGQHAMTLLAGELAGRGYRSVFFTRPPLDPDHRYVRALAETNTPVVVLPRFDVAWWARLLVLVFATSLVLPYMVARRAGPDRAWTAARSVVLTRIARLERRMILGRLTRQLRAETDQGRPVVLHIWGPAALTPLLLEWAEREGVPSVYHEMGEADEQYVRTWDLAPTVAALPRADAVVCCSSAVEASVRRVYGYAGPVAQVPFMIADPGDGWQSRNPSANGRVTFGAIGRLVPHKRHSDLLAAVKSLSDGGRDVGLVIAGSGPMLDPLKAEAARLGIADRVTFTGEFDRLADVMAGFDVFVLASASESQCMPITESMAYGKPVIASDFGGMPDFVRRGETGLLVPVGDVPALTEAMRALADDPALREWMGAEGRRAYGARYTPDRVTAGVEAVYDRLLADRPAAGLKLAYVVEYYATFIIDEIDQLRRLGAKVTLLSAFRPKPEADPKKDAYRRESLYFPDGYPGVVSANLACLFTRPLAYLRALRLVRRQGASVHMLLLAACFARRLRADGIQHLHGTFGTRTTTLAAAVGLLSGRSYSFTTHAYDIYRPNPSLVWKTNGSAFMRTISAFNKRYIEAAYPGVDGDKIKVVYLGVEPGRFVPQPRPAPAPKQLRIVAVGSLIEQKGHVILIRACRVLLDRGYRVSCEIIGEGEKRRVIEKEIARLGMAEHVRLTGELPYEAIQKHLNAADVFALPCIDLRGKGEHVDGIPVAIMEAMALGMPVVSTNLSGIPELVEDGVSGLLVQEQDEAALADVLARLCDDSGLRARLGLAARKQIEEKFDLKENTKALAALFREAC